MALPVKRHLAVPDENPQVFPYTPQSRPLSGHARMESLTSTPRAEGEPHERSQRLLFGAVFCEIGLFPYWRVGNGKRDR
jgi:hypothetical protein